MLYLIITIICSGIFGGTVNFFQLYSDTNKGWINYWKCVIVGLGASFLVPLFLQMISSNLIENSKTSDKDLLVFIGFCLIASIFSKRFIETLGEKVLKQVRDAKETAEEAKEIAQTNKEEVKVAQQDLTSLEQRVEDVNSKTDLKNVDTKSLNNVDASNKRLLIQLANAFVEKTTIKDYTERLKVKGELKRRMGEIIVRNNLSKNDLLKENQSEGMLIALAYAVELNPIEDGLDILNKISKLASQFFTKHSILDAYITLSRNNLITPTQLVEVISIIKSFRENADGPLLRKIDSTLKVLDFNVLSKEE